MFAHDGAAPSGPFAIRFTPVAERIPSGAPPDPGPLIAASSIFKAITASISDFVYASRFGVDCKMFCKETSTVEAKRFGFIERTPYLFLVGATVSTSPSQVAEIPPLFV